LRGEARPDCDYDFLIELKLGRSAFEIGGLLMDLLDLLDAKVDIVTDKGLNSTAKQLPTSRKNTERAASDLSI
jgi:predicted nucleotidyltransferase